MGKIKRLIAIAALITIGPVFSLAANAAPAPKSTSTPISIPAVTGVSATWVTGEGFVVNWAPIAYSAKTPVTGYTVTASSGQVCKANGAATSECVFSSSKVPFGFRPYVRYTFTVVANASQANSPVSAPSNAAGWFGAPGYPGFVVTKTISDTQIDVKWVPDSSTGGISLNGYKVYYWPLNRDSEQKMISSLDNSVSITGIEKSTWYVVAVQSCTYYGCSTSDWAFQATTPAAASTSTTLLPKMINGGNASTTCWDYVIDGGSATSLSTTVRKAASACPVATTPSSWPTVDPTATTSPNLPIATKFNPKSKFSLANASYSMSYKWNDLGIFSSNFTRTRSLAPRVYESLTPSICSIINKNGATYTRLHKAGVCSIRMSIKADETFVETPWITSSFTVKN